MLTRKLFIGALALVILGRGVHCLCLDASLCARATEAGSERPLTDPTESDPNESGCICKGALVRVPCLLMRLNPQPHLMAFVHVLPAPAAWLSPYRSEGALHDFLCRPARSGKAMRAWLASWQI
jgi:hypothetical protein